MKKQRMRTIVAEPVPEIKAPQPELLSRICTRCLQRAALPDANLCRQCERSSQRNPGR